MVLQIWLVAYSGGTFVSPFHFIAPYTLKVPDVVNALITADIVNVLIATVWKGSTFTN